MDEKINSDEYQNPEIWMIAVFGTILILIFCLLRWSCTYASESSADSLSTNNFEDFPIIELGDSEIIETNRARREAERLNDEIDHRLVMSNFLPAPNKYWRSKVQIREQLIQCEVIDCEGVFDKKEFRCPSIASKQRFMKGKPGMGDNFCLTCTRCSDIKEPDVSSSQSVSSTQSLTACVICLEGYSVGQVIAFSPNPFCRHM